LLNPNVFDVEKPGMTDNNMDTTERRGTLTYVAPNGYDIDIVRGHFMLSSDRQKVIMRKIGGRNRWHFCSSNSIIKFENN
jgi:hypothetical protein